MNIVTTGIINTQHYDACIDFYRDLFDLNALFQEHYGDFRLTCFEFNDAYLMVETDVYAKPAGKTIQESVTKLAFTRHDPGFARIYMAEKKRLLGVLQ